MFYHAPPKERERRQPTVNHYNVTRGGVLQQKGLSWQAAQQQTHTCSDIFCRP